MPDSLFFTVPKYKKNIDKQACFYLYETNCGITNFEIIFRELSHVSIDGFIQNKS